MGPNPICLESGKKPCEDRDWAGGRMPVKAEAGLRKLQARKAKDCRQRTRSQGEAGERSSLQVSAQPCGPPGSDVWPPELKE